VSGLVRKTSSWIAVDEILFPTDVIAGAVAGTGVGILVPHWHRRSPWHAAWLAQSPIPHGMGASLEGFF
jgi:hypothetical protein